MLQEKPVNWLTVKYLIYAVVDLIGHLMYFNYFTKYTFHFRVNLFKVV